MWFYQSYSITVQRILWIIIRTVEGSLLQSFWLMQSAVEIKYGNIDVFWWNVNNYVGNKIELYLEVYQFSLLSISLLAEGFFTSNYWRVSLVDPPAFLSQVRVESLKWNKASPSTCIYLLHHVVMEPSSLPGIFLTF